MVARPKDAEPGMSGQGITVLKTLDQGYEYAVEAAPTLNIVDWSVIGKGVGKGAWTVRASFLKAAKDSKDRYHSDPVGALAEAWGITQPYARKALQDYELLLLGKESVPSMEQIIDFPPPIAIVRAARENTETPEDATTALADYRERKEAGEAPSVRQFATELKNKHVKPVPVADKVPFTESEEVSTDEEVGETVDEESADNSPAAFLAKQRNSPNTNQIRASMADLMAAMTRYSAEEVGSKARLGLTKAARLDEQKHVLLLSDWLAAYAKIVGKV